MIRKMDAKILALVVNDTDNLVFMLYDNADSGEQQSLMLKECLSRREAAQFAKDLEYGIMCGLTTAEEIIQNRMAERRSFASAVQASER